MSGPRTTARARPAAVAALASALLLVVAGTVGACGETARRSIRPGEDLFDPNPSRRLAAVQAVRETGDRRYVPTLIELLDDRDQGVRFAAGQTLEELTGRSTGYAAWAAAGDRRGQVEDWRAWWRSRTGATPRGCPAPCPAPPPPPRVGSVRGGTP